MKKLALFLVLCLMVQCFGLPAFAEEYVPAESVETVEEAPAAEPVPEVKEAPAAEPVPEVKEAPAAEPVPEAEEKPAAVTPSEEKQEEPSQDQSPAEEPAENPAEEKEAAPAGEPSEENEEEEKKESEGQTGEVPQVNDDEKTAEEIPGEVKEETEEEPAKELTEEKAEEPAEEAAEESEEESFTPGLVLIKTGEKLYQNQALTQKTGELAEDAVVYADELQDGVLAVTYVADGETKKAFVAEDKATFLSEEETGAWKESTHEDAVLYQEFELEAAVFVLTAAEETAGEETETEETEAAEEIEVSEDEALLEGGAPSSAEFTWRKLSTPGECEITECRSDSTDISIPYEFIDELGNHYKVTKLSDTTFARNTSITSVMLDDAIDLKEIAPGCFEGCTNLRSISFATNAPIIDIPDNAFKDCTGLNSISWSTNITKIGANAFENCTALTTLTLPNKLEHIQASAFEKCTGLQGVTLPSTMKDIGKNAFSGCTAIVNALLNNGLTSIGDSVFAGCSKLKGIYIPDTVTYMGSSAFEGCSAATDLSLSTGLTEINNFAFKGCSGLTTLLDIPATITRIGREAFQGCEGIKVVYLRKSSTKTIGALAFEGINSSATVFVEDADASIGVDALKGVKTIVGWYGSSADKFATSHDIQFLPYDVINFVDAVYQGFFSRNADPDASIDFSRKLAFKQITAADFIVTLLDSDEFKTKNPKFNDIEQAILNGLFKNQTPAVTPPTELDDPADYVQGKLGIGVSLHYVAKQYIDCLPFRDDSYVFKTGMINKGTIKLTESRDVNEITTAFVARCYSILLDRTLNGTEPERIQDDPAGLNFWTGRLLAGRETGASMIASFLRQPEWADQVVRYPLTPQDQVDRLYRTMLDRSGMGADANDWWKAMDPNLGTFPNKSYCSIEYVAHGISTAPEFIWICQKYGVKPGVYQLSEARDKNIMVNRFVTRCYDMALGRVPDVPGLNDWCQKLLSGKISGSQMAHDFVFSYEMEYLSGNWNPLASWVTKLYECYFGRSPDAAGLTYWTTVYGGTREQMAAEFAATPEYRDIMNYYGIR